MPDQPVIPLAAADLDGIVDALNDGSGQTEWYFHTGTGDVRVGGDDWDRGYEADELEEQGWVGIYRSSGSRGAFEDMEVFADAIGDVRIRDLLLRSLEGKGAFRRFRDAKYEFIELKDPWAAWSDAREKIRAVQWLLDGDYVDEREADAAINGYRTASTAALDEVRTLGGVVYDVGGVPAAWAEISGLLEQGKAVTITTDGVPWASIARFDR